jgi:hypothetical protein
MFLSTRKTNTESVARLQVRWFEKYYHTFWDKWVMFEFSLIISFAVFLNLVFFAIDNLKVEYINPALIEKTTTS